MSHIRNIEQISEDVKVDYFQMQHFMTESNWDARKLIDQVSLDVSNTLPKRKLTGLFHFAKVYIWNKGSNLIEQRILVIRNMRTGKKKVEIKYSFTNANFDQYTPEALAYMQAQRYFVESSIKESKYILGIDQFQTRK